MNERMFPVLSFSRGLAFPQSPISCLDETPNNPYVINLVQDKKKTLAQKVTVLPLIKSIGFN